MSGDSPEDRFRALLEEMVGMPLPDDPATLREVADTLGVDPSNPRTWATLERQLDEMRPLVGALRAGPEYGWPPPVERAFQRTIERLGHDAYDPAALAREPAGVRMLMSTRAVEGAINDGGWPSLFYNDMDGHLDGAVAGYRLLGLEGHAALAERARAHGFDLDAEDDPFWHALDAEWLQLPDPEAAREAYLSSHAAEFRFQPGT